MVAGGIVQGGSSRWQQYRLAAMKWHGDGNGCVKNGL
jgi:hypothetical protein